MVLIEYLKKLNPKTSNKLELDDRNKIIYSCLFFVAISIHLILLDFSPISLSIDSYAYISSTAWLRPHGYDLFLYLTGTHIFKNFITPIIFQIFLISFLPIIIYRIFKLLNASNAVSLVLTFLCFFYTYPFVMSLQIMSESVYIFGCSLTILYLLKYNHDPNLKNLFVLILLIFIVNEIRSTLVLLYPTLFFIIFFTQKKNKYFLKHLCMSFIIFVIHFNLGSISIKISAPSNGHENDRTYSIGFNKHINFDKSSKNIIPYFMIYSLVSTIETNQGHKDLIPSNFISPYNGENSKKLFLNIIELLINQKGFRQKLLTEELDYTGQIKNSNSGLDGEEILRNYANNLNISYIHDILSNKATNSHKWPLIIDQMYRDFGYEYSGNLLNKVMQESFQKYPQYFLEIFPKNIKFMFFRNFFHDRVYIRFLVNDLSKPKLYPQLLNIYPLAPNAYASQVYRIDSLIGNDDYFSYSIYHRDIYFHDSVIKSLVNIFKFRDKKVFNAYKNSGNKFALPNFFYESLNQIFVFLVILLIPIAMFFSIFSRFWYISIPLAISGILIIGIINFIVPQPRHICMNTIFLIPLYVTGFSGISSVIKKLLK